MLPLKPQIGDLLLLAPISDGKSPNTGVQSLLRLRRASYSHVAISVGEFTSIHAMPQDGVHALRTRELIAGRLPEQVVALRHKHISVDSDLQQRLRARLFFYYKQKYNTLFWFRRQETASFCSELAAKAYADVGIPLSHRNPKYVLPVDIESLGGEDWITVTSAYVTHPQLIDDSPLSRAIDEILGSSVARRMEIEDFLIVVEEILHTAELNQISVAETQNTLLRILGLPMVAFKTGRDSWLRKGQAKTGRR